MRPKTVDWFEYLMIATLIIGVVRIMIDQQEIPPALRSDATLLFQGVLVLLLLVMTLLVSRKGSNIVRWITLIMVLLGTLMYLPMIGVLINQGGDPFSGLLSTPQVVFQLVAVYLVFRPESRPWFQKQAPAKETKA